MTQERPLPRIPKSRAALLVLSFVAVAAVTVCLTTRFDTGFWPALLLIAVGLVGFFYFFRSRCPECHGELVERHDYIHGTKRFRLLLDCPSCQIGWDTGQIGDDDWHT
jgi:hypothetical protein